MEIWDFVLGGKFNRKVRPGLREFLLATGEDTELVELGRGATNGGVMQKNGEMSKKTFWAGCVKPDGELHGSNFMGRQMMRRRKALFDAEAADVMDEDDKPLDLTEYVKRRDAKRKAYDDEDNKSLVIKRHHKA